MSNPHQATDQYLVEHIHRPAAEYLIEVACPRLGERVLDLACGTGIVARLVAPKIGSEGSIRAVDVSREVLVLAQKLYHATVLFETHAARAEALPFHDDHFDLVVCAHGLQHFAHPDQACREMARVLRPGGRAAVMVWGAIQDAPSFLALCQALREDQLTPIGDKVAILQSFSIPTAEELRRLMEAGGFTDLQVSTHAIDTSYASARDFLTGGGEGDSALPDALAARVEAELSPWVAKDGTLSAPMSVHVAVGVVQGS